MIITIDGPSGSGKSTLSVSLAKYLNFFCLNSGYLYRGLAYVLQVFYGYDEVKNKNSNVRDVQAILHSGQFRYEYEQGLVKIYFGDDDITQFLKIEDVSQRAAQLAQQKNVREEIKIFERKLAENKDLIAEGRACGSVAFPDAQIKFFLDASIQVRAQRLQADQAKKGIEISAKEAFDYIQKRDQLDLQRSIDPLIKPQGAIVLDSTSKTKQEIFEEALIYIKKNMVL